MPAVPVSVQRRLLLHNHALFGDPTVHVTPAVARRVVERLGFVQLDSINVVARGHDLILASRLDGYRPAHLATLLEKRRTLFEHWTHDASVLPVAWFVSWRHRARRMVANPWIKQWLSGRLGRNGRQAIDGALDRIRREGPLMSRDFGRPASDATQKAWWGWKPAKAALEYLWWRGDLSVAARVNFQKVYDLTERHLPDVWNVEPPPERTYVDWACREALTRLVFATPREIRGFHGAVTVDEARAWCARGQAEGSVTPVRLEGLDGKPPRAAWALADWRRRAARAEAALAAAPDRLRWLSPFDPVARDRTRLERLFGFAYRFEAFVPASKRRHGYYVLPVLRGERMVARFDAKLHRDRSVLELKSLTWEDGAGRTKKERRLLEEAAARLATFVGAGTAEIRS